MKDDMEFQFGNNKNEIEYSENDSNDSSNESNESFEKKPQNIYQNKIYEEHEKLAESISTNYSIKQSQSNTQMHYNQEPPQLIIYEHSKEKPKPRQNSIINEDYTNILNCIIDKGEIVNSVIISENDDLINFIILEAINNNLYNTFGKTINKLFSSICLMKN